MFKIKNNITRSLLVDRIIVIDQLLNFRLAVKCNPKDAGTRSWLSVFEVASGRELKRLPSNDGLGQGGIAFSPDGKLLASRVNAVSDSALAGSLNLIDTGTWLEVRSLAKTGFGMSLGLGDRRATPLSFSRDGRWVAASLGDGVGLFDTATGERIQNLRTRQRVSAVTPGGTSQHATANEAMAQAGFDPDLMRQMRESVSEMTGAGGLLGRLTGLSSSALSFSPDGRLLTASSPHVVWDLVAGAPQPPAQQGQCLYRENHQRRAQQRSKGSCDADQSAASARNDRRGAGRRP
jgi:WD40 repeat protein